MIKRIIEDKILADFRRKKIIVLLGARQVGKTTLLSAIEGGFRKILSLNCDNVDDVLELEGKTSTELNHLLSPYDLVLIATCQEYWIGFEDYWRLKTGYAGDSYRFFLVGYGK